jgi:hypothetical protein
VKASEALSAIGHDLMVKAAEAHVKGMNLAKQGARVDQLARLASEKVSETMLATMLESGIARCVDGRYEAVDVEDVKEPSAPIDYPLTNKNIGNA